MPSKEPFWLGGAAACMSVCFTHPLDQTKYRMQVLKSQESMFSLIVRSAGRDGIPSLWTGLSGSILRQGSYSTARFGIHTVLSQRVMEYTGQKRLSLGSNIACAGVAGGIAGVVGNPAEVVLVRMCADGAKPLSQRFGYSNAIEALWRIIREEGVQVFGKGLSANITRSVLMNVSQIATYSSAKQYLVSHMGLADDIKTHAAASLAAGTMATTLCAPADGLGAVLRSGLREEGALFLMKGWTPAWLRLTPHTVLTFVFMEKLRQLTTIGIPWLHTRQIGREEEQVLR
ncbi:unnamed protein product [Clonostachys byssicola]|uniref:Mitochondrial dicarboxylate transporter n=1 Tax=Clonostachys byssicola TaxID=160290 RepID=A0A9N9Y8C8_9HYPO|nr:unnamed protein product [Clonostachys byssicola]